MKRWHFLLYLTSLPNDLVGWLVVLFIRYAWGERLEWESPRSQGLPGGPVLVCEIREGSWAVTPGTWPKGFYLIREPGTHPRTWEGTTLGHAIFYGPGRRARDGERWRKVQVHEHVHVEQSEAAMLGSFIVGVAIALWGQSTAAVIFGCVVWSLGVVLMGAANWTTAVLRGEDAYRGSHHEEAAYAIDAHYEKAESEKELS